MEEEKNNFQNYGRLGSIHIQISLFVTQAYEYSKTIKENLTVSSIIE